MPGDLTSPEARVIHAQLQAVKDGVGRVESVLTDVSSALRSLVRVEERQRSQQESIERAHTRLDDHEERIQPIERDVPVLKETRGWVIAGVLAVFAFMGYIVLGSSLGIKPVASIVKVAP